MNPSALEILLDQAKERANDASKTLAKTRQQLTGARDKLHMLEQYMQEVSQNQQIRGAGGGITGFQLQNQNAFNNKILEAVSQQTRQVEFFVATETHQLSIWQKALAEQKKYEALLEREKKREQAIENKRDQKMNDEYAARIHRVRTSGESA